MRRFQESFAYWCAVGFGSGLIKPAPGTWGTLVGVGLFWFGLTFFSSPLILGFLVISTLLGGYVCRIGGERLGEVDHGSIVWDEIVAIGWLLWLIALFYPLTWFTVLLAFVLFRVFDIFKPWPISRVDAWHTPWSVMLDDLLAFVYAGIVFFMLIPYFYF